MRVAKGKPMVDMADRVERDEDFFDDASGDAPGEVAFEGWSEESPVVSRNEKTPVLPRGKGETGKGP